MANGTRSDEASVPANRGPIVVAATYVHAAPQPTPPGKVLLELDEDTARQIKHFTYGWSSRPANDYRHAFNAIYQALSRIDALR